MEKSNFQILSKTREEETIWLLKGENARNKHQGGGEPVVSERTVKKYSTLRMCKISCSCLSLTFYPSSLLVLNHTLVQPVDVLTVLQPEM